MSASESNLKKHLIDFTRESLKAQTPFEDYTATIAEVLGSEWPTVGKTLLKDEPELMKVFEHYVYRAQDISVLIEPDEDEQFGSNLLEMQQALIKKSNPGLHKVMSNYKNYHDSEGNRLTEEQRALINQLKDLGIDLEAQTPENSKTSEVTIENRTKIVPVRLSDSEVTELDSITNAIQKKTGFKIKRSWVIRELLLNYGNDLVNKYKE
jgi:hypothetical protein